MDVQESSPCFTTIVQWFVHVLHMTSKLWSMYCIMRPSFALGVQNGVQNFKSRFFKSSFYKMVSSLFIKSSSVFVKSSINCIIFAYIVHVFYEIRPIVQHPAFAPTRIFSHNFVRFLKISDELNFYQKNSNEKSV